MKKTYQRPTALVVRVVTGNLLQSLSNFKNDSGSGTIITTDNGPGADKPALTQRMYGIEVE